MSIVRYLKVLLLSQLQFILDIIIIFHITFRCPMLLSLGLNVFVGWLP